MIQTMWKTTIVQVLLCLYFSNSICYADITLDGLTSSETLSYLKDVTVWNDKKNTSLREILGDNLATENVDKKMVTDLAFKALCCSYTTKLLDFIDASYWIFRTYRIVEDSSDENTVKCIGNGIEYLRSNRNTVLNMFAVVRHYSNKFNLNMDKNFSDAIMSINILLNNKNYEVVNRSILYIKSTIELYNNDYCSLPKLKNRSFSVQLDHKCNEEEKINKIVCLLKSLDEPILTSVWFPYEIKSDEITQVQQLFDPANYMLRDIIDTRVVSDKKSTSIKHLVRTIGSIETTLEKVHDVVSSSFQGEYVFKYQMLIVEHIGALILCLVSFMINYESPGGQQIRFGDNSDQLFRSYNQAVQTLESLRPATFIGTVLKDLRYHTLFTVNKQHVIDSIRFYFQNCAFTLKEIEDFIHSDNEKYSAKQIAGFLDDFVKSLQLMAPNLFAVNVTGLEPTENMFADVVFITNKHIRELTQINVSNWITNYCQYSDNLTKYFINGDIIMSSCRISESNRSENNEEMVENWFLGFKSHIETIRPYIKILFEKVIDPISDSPLFSPVIHRLLEALYSITLYMDNDYWNEDSNVQGSVQDVETVATKMEEINRAHRTIIFTLEQFSSERCSIESCLDYVSSELGLSLPYNKSQCKEKMKDIYDSFIEYKYDDVKYNFFMNSDESFYDEYDARRDDILSFHQRGGDSTSTEKQLCSSTENIKIDDGEQIKSKTEIDESGGISDFSDETDDDIFSNLFSDDTLDQFHEPKNYLFKSVIKNTSEQHPEMSKILNRLQVAWYGKMSSLSDIYDFVKNQVDVKYVYEYLSKLKKMILFMTYEKIIKVIQSIGDTETKNIDKRTKKDIKHILRNYYRKGYPGVQWIHRRISQFFNSVSPEKPYDSVDISNMISCLKTEQTNLGVEFNRNYEEDEKITCKIDLTDVEKYLSLSEEFKTEDSRSAEFQEFDINSNKPNYGKYINQKNNALELISGKNNIATTIEIDEKVLGSINQLKLYNFIVTQFVGSYTDVYSDLLMWNNINLSIFIL